MSDGIYVDQIIFFGKAITIRSVNGAEATTIDGNKTGSVVQFVNGEGPDSVIDGFTITNGDIMGSGGGISCFSSSPTIRKCIIKNNSSEPDGGGILCSGASPTLTDCVITENETRTDDGGGLALLFPSSPTLNRCVISRNTSPSEGGGFYITGNSNPEITNCSVVGNSAGSHGGGFAVHDARSLKIVNTTISGNSGGGKGGGIYLLSSENPVIANCTISGNRTLTGGGVLVQAVDPPLKIVNSIVWGNTASEFSGPEDTTHAQRVRIENPLDTPPIVAYSDIEGGNPPGNTQDQWTEIESLASDPLFRDPRGAQLAPTVEGDYRLTAPSPCIDAGTDDLARPTPPSHQATGRATSVRFSTGSISAPMNMCSLPTSLFGGLCFLIRASCKMRISKRPSGAIARIPTGTGYPTSSNIFSGRRRINMMSWPCQQYSSLKIW